MLCLWVLGRGLQALLLLENDSLDAAALFVRLHKHSGMQRKKRRSLEDQFMLSVCLVLVWWNQESHKDNKNQLGDAENEVSLC